MPRSPNACAWPSCARPPVYEDIDYRTPRGLDRSLINALASGRWLHEHNNILILGPTGTGKSFVATALGNQAARDGFSVRYRRLCGSSAGAACPLLAARGWAAPGSIRQRVVGRRQHQQHCSECDDGRPRHSDPRMAWTLLTQ